MSPRKRWRKYLRALLLILTGIPTSVFAQEATRSFGLRVAPLATAPTNCTSGKLCLWSPSSGANANLPVWRKADGTDVAMTGGGGGGSSFYQTLQLSGTPLTQQPVFNLSSDFSAVNNSGSTRSDISLSTTGVSAGSCTNCNLTFDSKGRISVAANGTTGGLTGPGFTAGDVPFATGTNTLGRSNTLSFSSNTLFVNSLNTDSIQSLSGDDLSVSTLNGNSINIYPTSFASAGNLTLSGGQATSGGGGLLLLSSGSGSLGNPDGDLVLDVGGAAHTGASAGLLSIGATKAQSITLGRSGHALTIPSNTTFTGTVALPATAVTPGSYTNSNITVAADGRVTAAANGSGGGYSTLSVNGTAATARPQLNFPTTFVLTDNPGSSRTDLTLATPSAPPNISTVSNAGSSVQLARANHTHGPQPYPTATAFGWISNALLTAGNLVVPDTGAGTLVKTAPAGAVAQNIVGAVLTAISTSSVKLYSWGDVATLNDDGTTVMAVGDRIKPSTTVAGAVMKATASDSAIGTVVTAAALGSVGVVLMSSNGTTLPATSVTPGSYTSSNITVGADGRITAASNGGSSGVIPLAFGVVKSMSDLNIATWQAGNYTLANSWAFFQNSTFTGWKVWLPDTSSRTIKFGLWDTTSGVLVNTKTVTLNTAGIQTISATSTTTLIANRKYLVSMYLTDGTAYLAGPAGSFATPNAINTQTAAPLGDLPIITVYSAIYSYSTDAAGDAYPPGGDAGDVVPLEPVVTVP